MQQNRKWSLIVGILIPVLMVVALILAIYLPGLFLKPKHDFLYTFYQSSYYSPSYEVVGNSLSIKCPSDSSYNQYYSYNSSINKVECTAANAGSLYLYNVTLDTTREISYSEAKKLSIRSNPISEDGYEVTSGSSSGSLMGIFGGHSSDYYKTKYIKGSTASKKININYAGSSSYYNFRFLGWVN